MGTPVAAPVDVVPLLVVLPVVLPVALPVTLPVLLSELSPSEVLLWRAFRSAAATVSVPARALSGSDPPPQPARTATHNAETDRKLELRMMGSP